MINAIFCTCIKSILLSILPVLYIVFPPCQFYDIKKKEKKKITVKQELLKDGIEDGGFISILILFCNRARRQQNQHLSPAVIRETLTLTMIKPMMMTKRKQHLDKLHKIYYQCYTQHDKSSDDQYLMIRISLSFLVTVTGY